MSLGLLAKDSIQDLEALGREAERAEEKWMKSANGTLETTSERSNEEASSFASVENGDLLLLETTTSDPNGSNHLAETITTSSTVTAGANPQQPEDDNNGIHQQYSGFRSQYDASLLFYQDDYYDYYSPDTFAPDLFMATNTKTATSSSTLERPNRWWCCIFPWMIISQTQMSTQQQSLPKSHSEAAATSENYSETATSRAAVVLESEDEDDGELSTSSSALGERLSEKERQAVLARLGLGQPDEIIAPSDHHRSTSSVAEDNNKQKLHHQQQQQSLSDHSMRSISAKKGLLNGIPVYDMSPLMQEEPEPHLCSALEINNSRDQKASQLKGILKNRRTTLNSIMKNGIIPMNGSYNDSSELSSTTTGPHRRRSLFPTYETRPKSSTNKSVSFAPMARVVTVKSRNDMTDSEKSDIWWQRSDYEDFRKTGRIITRAMLEGGSEIWLNASSHESSSSSAKPNENKDRAANDAAAVTEDKWWHKFGHSRRGLEHVVSMEEGRQRQANVKNAIRCVLDEQARQKLYNRVDAEKLRNVSLNHTSWARDLALAAGASDADAVESSFAADRRSREFFLSKMVKSSPSTNKIRGKMPQFMQPPIPSGATATTGANARTYIQQQLDANTTAQLRFRRRKVSPLDPSRSTAPALLTKEIMDKNNESCEPLHDPKPEEKHHKSMAEQAAGFSASTEEKVNMAAVLSGLGAGLTVNEKAKAKIT
jgi:hypothetical protein